MSSLKRRLDDVVAAPDAVTAELEAAKRAREAADTDLRGSQLQASIAEKNRQNMRNEIKFLGWYFFYICH